MLTALLFIAAFILGVLNLTGHIAISWWWIALVFPGIQIIAITLACLIGWLFVTAVRRNDPAYIQQKALQRLNKRYPFG